MRGALGLWLAVASAHTPQEDTARVTLRDDHVQVEAEIDLFRLVHDTPTHLAIADDLDVIAELDRLGDALQRSLSLQIDGQRAHTRLRGLPTPPELRALAATLSASGQDHGARVRLTWEVPDATPGARQVSLAMPHGLGPTITTFVQPATQYVQPDTTAVFDVLQATAPPPTTPWQAPLATATLGAGVGLVAGRLQRRERTP